MRRRLLSVIGAMAVLALVLPGAGQAAEGKEPTPYGFFATGTHGWKLVAFAIPPPPEAATFDPEDKGSLGLYLERGKNAIVTYAVPTATVTPTSLEVDLGARGKISVTRVATGRKKSMEACGKRKRVPIYRFEGTIEFHGEEGFTEVDATSGKGGDLEVTSCPDGEEGGPAVPGKSLPGAHLEVRREVEHDGIETSSFSLDATKDRPGARTRISAEVMELEGAIEIHRGITTWAGADALSYEPRHLNAATVKPPAPFSGWGHFTRRPGSAESESGRWTGNLTVDFPGRADVPASGPGFTASLERARR